MSLTANNQYMRYRLGDSNPRQYPFNATVGAPGALGQGGPGYPIAVGDMVWVDPSSGGLSTCSPLNLIGLEAIKGGDAFPWTSSLSTTQGNFAPVFAGIAAQAWTATLDLCSSNPIGNYGVKDGVLRVDTTGVFEMDCALNTIVFNGDLLAPAQNGSSNAILAQTVVKTSTKANAIGTVVFAERSGYGQFGKILMQLSYPNLGQGVGSSLLPTTTTTSTTTTTTTTTTAASDARLKQNVRRIGTFDGMGVYSFTFLGGRIPFVGLMAQDVYKRYPEAVTVGGDDPHTAPWLLHYPKLMLAIGVRKAARLSRILDTVPAAQV